MKQTPEQLADIILRLALNEQSLRSLIAACIKQVAEDHGVLVPSGQIRNAYNRNLHIETMATGGKMDVPTGSIGLVLRGTLNDWQNNTEAVSVPRKVEDRNQPVSAGS